MAQPDNFLDTTHIPTAVKPLAPYIKSRQETRQIRQALTAYLRSLIEFNDDRSSDLAQSHLSLCTPTDAVAGVKRIPVELSGLRKEYLKALAANVAARKELTAATENVAALRHQRTSPNRPSEDADLHEPGAELREYLALLRDQRRHAKLQVFQNYLEEIKSRDVNGLDNTGNEGEPPLPEIGAEGRSGTETDVDELVHNLEKAVVRAKSQLDYQKQLFEKATAQHDSRDIEVSPDVKAHALQKTRDELVQWVEERLVGQGDPDESVLQELPPEEIEEAQRGLEERRIQIEQQYAAYLQARQELLHAASRACQPVTVAPKPPSRPANKNELVPEVPPPNPIDILSHTEEILIPLTKTQKSLALQKSYLSGLLAKEKSTTLRALHRLREESHLLPEYPIPAHPLRFNVPTLQRTQSQPPDPKTDEVVSLAEAWAFASDAAAVHAQEFVQPKIALGTEIAHDAGQTLTEVYGMLNQEVEGADRAVSGAHSTGKWSGTRGKKPPSPWSPLNGRVGVE